MAIMKKMELVGTIDVSDLETDTVTSPTGEDLAIVAPTSQDVLITVGDNAGSNKVSIKDSDASEVAKIDSNGVITGTIVNTPVLNDADADTLKIHGEVTTRNTADNSMYVAITDSSGHERGWKTCFSPALNGGGYFESHYVNTKVAASMAGTVRASEHKVSITGTANMSGEVAAILAKVNVETGATIASAVGLDVLLDPEGSATVTAATGIRVNGDAKMTTMLDLSSYDKATNSAIELPNVDGNAAVSIAALESAFGTDNNKEGIIGLYQDNADAVWFVVGNSRVGKYYKIQTAIVDS